MMMPKLEETILLLVLKAGPDATAGGVQAALSETLGREQSFGAVFTTLDRLNRKKFVRWRKGKPDEDRGGRAPRLYTITALGQTTLKASLRTTQALAADVGLGAVPVFVGA
jgi:DNA-binding PadR family transcriptional regulator